MYTDNTPCKAECADLSIVKFRSPAETCFPAAELVCSVFLVGLLGMKLPAAAVDSWTSVGPQQCQVKGPF